MEWMGYADEIRSLLGLEGSPVAVTFSMEPVDNAVKGKHRVCDAFLKAHGGATIDLIVTIPYHRFPGVMRSIDRCTAGRAKFEVPAAMRRRRA